MNKEFEFYHGVVFTKLVQASNKPISFKRYLENSTGSYIINNEIGIYIKYCKKRMSPWKFSFLKSHQSEILKLKKDFPKIFVLLVCGDDGVVVLGHEELSEILDEIHKDIEWISASRARNKEYTIKGSDGDLKKKIGKNNFPKRVLEFES